MSGYTGTYLNERCPQCGKPGFWVGDVPPNGWIKGQEPYCTCPAENNKNNWQFCPHCGKELK